jgi:AraC-like DNA-binding protein
MQNSDDEVFEPVEVPRPISAVGIELVTKGVEQQPHRHQKAQLILTVRGLITCEVAHGLWMVARQRALWIPGGLEHSVRGVGDLELYALFIDPELASRLPKQCSSLSASPLLQELVIAASHMPQLYDVDGADGRMVRTMIDQLERAPLENLHLPMPSDPRLRRIAQTLSSDPANRTTIGEWAKILAMSERSLSRFIMKQTGMRFGRWRQLRQVMFAIEQLAEGVTVQAVAFDLGYESASAFITMFKKVMGQPPGQYFASHRNEWFAS